MALAHGGLTCDVKPSRLSKAQCLQRDCTIKSMFFAILFAGCCFEEARSVPLTAITVDRRISKKEKKGPGATIVGISIDSDEGSMKRSKTNSSENCKEKCGASMPPGQGRHPASDSEVPGSEQAITTRGGRCKKQPFPCWQWKDIVSLFKIVAFLLPNFIDVDSQTAETSLTVTFKRSVKAIVDIQCTLLHVVKWMLGRSCLQYVC
jgi:hypothetical protein